MIASEFRVLGTLEVVVDGRVIPIGSSRLKALLATLLLRANKVVGFDALIDAVWGKAVPRNPRPALYTLVARLRSVVKDVAFEAGNDGYRIVVDGSQIDVCRFEAGLIAARTARDREIDVLRQTLELWRGEPLAERRLQALERLLELDLAAGQHHVVLPSLRELAEAHPMRERLWALLMIALFRCGQQAEAFRVYATVRRRLVDELGVEPGKELRQAQQVLLAGDEDEALPVECQLPIDIGDFTNRDDELGQVLAAFQTDTGVPVLTITGPPGMGKSALAVRVAHRLVEHYPDGQWFLRLNGASATPRPVKELLAATLRSAGVLSTAIPEDVEARSALLRSRLSGRRVLMVLNDAGSVDQVAPLLPGRPGSAVLVSSRSELAGLSVLYGAKRLALQPLSTGHARDLVARIVGSRRCEQDETAARELSDLCGRLPLALRIAAANLASRPDLRISRYAEDLRTGDRLAKLATPGESRLAVRTAFDVSFTGLGAREQRAFSLLGVVPGGDFTVSAAAALFGRGADEAEDVLGLLFAANLLEAHGDDRFRLHDLIRVYAADRSREYDADEAFRRLADWYLHSVHAAVARCLASMYMSPLGSVPTDVAPLRFSTDGEALRWLDAERLNYLAVIEHAAVHGPKRYAWLLVDAARPDLYFQNLVDEMERVVVLGLACARAVGDRRGVATMLLTRGSFEVLGGRYDKASDTLVKCRGVATEAGAAGVLTAAVATLCALTSEAGPLDDAVKYAEEVFELVDQGVEQGDARKLAVLVNGGWRTWAQGVWSRPGTASRKELRWRSGCGRRWPNWLPGETWLGA